MKIEYVNYGTLEEIKKHIDHYLRSFEEGELLIKSNYVVKFGMKKENEKEISVHGICLLGSNPKDQHTKLKLYWRNIWICLFDPIFV